ncbi:MAG: SIMPL domain-containing protein [Candidatus Saccharibacteria bacterium]|nr:SIMPL domain-containing protein [Candidatus Saccharibacteria bacterium]
MNDPASSNHSETLKNKTKLIIDYRIISLVLLLIIIAIIFIWKPWTSKSNNDRTVSVTGEASVTAAPDEYSFTPNYTFKNSDKAIALADLTKKSKEITDKIKSLGVSDKDIKTNSSGYDYNYFYDVSSKQATYTLDYTIKVTTAELSQKVQDYITTTSPTGAVSPQVNFSDAKRKELESQARDKATKEARSKADQSAKNLGFKVSGVKSVTDGAGFGNMNQSYPIALDSSVSNSMARDATNSLVVQPGENKLQYSVSVVYFIR